MTEIQWELVISSIILAAVALTAALLKIRENKQRMGSEVKKERPEAVASKPKKKVEKKSEPKVQFRLSKFNKALVLQFYSSKYPRWNFNFSAPNGIKISSGSSPAINASATDVIGVVYVPGSQLTADNVVVITYFTSNEARNREHDRILAAFKALAESTSVVEEAKFPKGKPTYHEF